MATVINNPSDNSGGSGILIGIVVAALLMIVIFVYGLPLVMKDNTAQNPGASINLELPAGNNGSGQ